MNKLAFITGGAGFIGSHLADELLRSGYRVRVLDVLEPQVHGPAADRPAYLDPEVEFVEGDVRDIGTLLRCLQDVDVVFHLAARVGVGQSMYRICDYADANVSGTAALMEALIDRPVDRLVVASSMSIYGEGLYVDARGGRVVDAWREEEQLREGRWDPTDADGRPLSPVPTPEDKPPALASVYALSKYDQERMCLIAGRAHGIPTVALRFFNAYGPRQALGNPYTGVLAIFASRLLRGLAPLIYEDGRQLRDFVNVVDIARGCRLAAEAEGVQDRVFNLGSGRPRTVLNVAEQLAAILDRRDIEPEVADRHRAGDIRHCFADISLAKELLGYAPTVAFEDGMSRLAEWLEFQTVDGAVPDAAAELQGHRLPA